MNKNVMYARIKCFSDMQIVFVYPVSCLYKVYNINSDQENYQQCVASFTTEKGAIDQK